MKEVLDYYQQKISGSGILRELDLNEKKYFLASFHREENVDNPENLESIVAVLDRLTSEYGIPVVVSTHPRTRKRLEEMGIQSDGDGIWFLKPFGFTDYIHLQTQALCTISDSGTISEEPCFRAQRS